MDGRSWLWNPPFELLLVVTLKIAAEGGREVLIAPLWPAKACFARLRALSSAWWGQNPTGRLRFYMQSMG